LGFLLGYIGRCKAALRHNGFSVDALKYPRMRKMSADDLEALSQVDSWTDAKLHHHGSSYEVRVGYDHRSDNACRDHPIEIGAGG